MRVSLGGVELRNFEKPDEANLGGETFVAIRKFPGGTRSIQFMGADYRPITWNGFFIGQDAYQRMLKIGNMRTAGKPVTFATDIFSFPVVITSFYPDVKTEHRIGFSITLERVFDEKGGGAAPKDSIDKAALAIAKKSPSTPAASTTTTYVVQPGDTLSKIAARLKKDPNKWPEIASNPKNQQALKNGPHNLRVGVTLYV
ncbi:LysM peptidoglycan-binding domain-containing protein [Brevibacillus sp. HD3.3A]|uniref:LysM peptidoglycan-binding domain-containing protein n=1 Tax=Brevibacillus sp. HD3.3A TaxID=2738979 RepID=UPI001E59D6A4|nr:LysM domain-containing protein [Brevibacillus sp. HD3.3A]UED70698.1 LysM peptidoglycan-binding domain-containing protein [Brevibacillus sp. HD3.3A]